MFSDGSRSSRLLHPANYFHMFHCWIPVARWRVSYTKIRPVCQVKSVCRSMYNFTSFARLSPDTISE